jgi:hypothetical protein
MSRSVGTESAEACELFHAGKKKIAEGIDMHMMCMRQQVRLAAACGEISQASRAGRPYARSTESISGFMIQSAIAVTWSNKIVQTNVF